MLRDIIYDGDMGGDDLWAIALLLAHDDKFRMNGVATVFGNVSQPQATRNVLDFLHWLGRDDVDVVQGADMPIDGLRPFGDDAYGENGIGGHLFHVAPAIPRPVDIADWYAERVISAPSKLTVFATGPATNLALFAQRHPHLISQIDEIVFMGGALETPGRDGAPSLLPDGSRRIGNITPFSEFNAYQDPSALNVLLSTGVAMTFMAADASQNVVLTPERQRHLLTLDDVYAPVFHKMLMAVETLDRTKFGVDGPFIHDPNVAVYALAPDLYKGYRLGALSFTEADPAGRNGERRGQTLPFGVTTDALWLNGVADSDKIVEIILDGLKRAISRAVA